MIFTSKGNKGYEIKYESDDTDTEKRIVEQGVALLRNMLVRCKEVEKFCIGISHTHGANH